MEKPLLTGIPKSERSRQKINILQENIDKFYSFPSTNFITGQRMWIKRQRFPNVSKKELNTLSHWKEKCRHIHVHLFCLFPAFFLSLSIIPVEHSHLTPVGVYRHKWLHPRLLRSHGLEPRNVGEHQWEIECNEGHHRFAGTLTLQTRVFNWGDIVAFNFFNPRFQHVKFTYSSYHNEKLLSDLLAKKQVDYKSWESTVSLGISFLAIKRITPIS